MLIKDIGEHVSIKEAFEERVNEIIEKNPKLPNDVIKVVKHIIGLDFKIKKVESKISSLRTLWSYSREVKKERPELKIGHFSRELSGEESDDFKIIKEWESLANIVSVPAKETMMGFSKSISWFQVILGCYLAQDLKDMRIGIDVFFRAHRLSQDRITMYSFSPEENAIMINAINSRATEGSPSLCQIAINLASVLNISEKRIYNRLYVLQNESKVLTRGPFKLEEDEIILESLFREKFECTVEDIRKIRRSEFVHLAELLGRRVKGIHYHWSAFLAPTLLAHHFGTLRQAWKKEIAKYVIDKKKIALQDINMDEISERWPFLTRASVIYALNPYFTIARKRGLEKRPLYEIVSDRINEVTDNSFGPAKMKHKEKVIEIYTRIAEEKAKLKESSQSAVVEQRS